VNQGQQKDSPEAHLPVECGHLDARGLHGPTQGVVHEVWPRKSYQQRGQKHCVKGGERPAQQPDVSTEQIDDPSRRSAASPSRALLKAGPLEPGYAFKTLLKASQHPWTMPWAALGDNGLGYAKQVVT
jgi:hypothetical protein